MESLLRSINFNKINNMHFITHEQWNEAFLHNDLMRVFVHCSDLITDEPLIVTEREYLDQLKQNIIL